jgi:cytochrome c-type biogenesis protein CcmH
MTLTRLWWSAAFALCLAAPAWSADVQEDPLDRQTREIAKDLRCTVCQNQSIADSEADVARDMRDIIRDQIKAGKSRDEILQYFVDRYGFYVLMKPPVQGTGAVLWLLPVVFLLIFALSAFWYLRQRRQTQAPTPAPSLSAEDLKRVRAAREGGEQ